MRGASIRRFSGALVVVAAMAGAGATATPASAAALPTCTTSVALAPAGTSGSCGFNSPTDYSTVAVTVDGTASVTLRCNGEYGYSYTVSRTFVKSGAWTAYTPGSCQMVLTSSVDETTATATVTPAMGPIYEPPPPPYAG